MCISHFIKKINICYFYKQGWMKFLQSILEENFVLSELLGPFIAQIILVGVIVVFT